VEPRWRTASVAASSCVDANIASTAALVQGDSALTWLGELRLPARLVDVNGDVHAVAGWP
jgi:thiamine biosynthesis lipoprotein